MFRGLLILPVAPQTRQARAHSLQFQLIPGHLGIPPMTTSGSPALPCSLLLQVYVTCCYRRGESEHRLWGPRDSCWNPGSATTCGVASGRRQTLVTYRGGNRSPRKRPFTASWECRHPRRENTAVWRVSGPPTAAFHYLLLNKGA